MMPSTWYKKCVPKKVSRKISSIFRVEISLKMCLYSVASKSSLDIKPCPTESAKQRNDPSYITD